MIVKPPLWEKQKEAVIFSKTRLKDGLGAGLLIDPGGGKTRIAIETIENLIRKKRAKLIYVVSNLAGLHVWVTNWDEWATYPVLFVDLHDTGVEGLREAQKLAKGENPVICLVNYESAPRIGRKFVEREVKGRKRKVFEAVDLTMDSIDWDIGIADESTSLKTPGSKISKYFRNKLRPRTKYRMILTGSAYTKRPLDAWAQIKFLTGEEVFPGPVARFKINYTIPHPHIRGAILGYRNLKGFTRRLKHCCVLIKRDEMVDTPPALDLPPRLIELSAASKKIYKDLTEEMYVELETLEKEGVTITAKHIFSVIRKQQQITSGFITPDDINGEKQKPIRIGTEKLDELAYLLHERDGDPTVIVTNFNEEEIMIAEMLKKEFKFTPKILNGSVKGRDARYKMYTGARDDRAFIVKQSVGAKAIDLTWANMIIFYSLSYNTIDYEQMLRRTDRPGQTRTCYYRKLLCKNTVDLRVAKVVENDLNLARQIEKNWRKLF